jgi:hypothetical protein
MKNRRRPTINKNKNLIINYRLFRAFKKKKKMNALSHIVVKKFFLFFNAFKCVP